jgi:Secretion system C-terminal sorting domain
MRNIFTLILILTLQNSYSQEKNEGPSAILTKQGFMNLKDSLQKDKSKPKDFISTNPLLVLDGVPVPHNTLEYINENDIEEIFHLKTESIIHCCHGGPENIIMITTKSSKLRKFIIKDFLEGKTIPGATVKFKSQKDKNDSLVIAANDSGFVLTNKLKPGVDYDIEVSSVGFKIHASHFKNPTSYNEQIIFLDQKNNILKEVVVTYGGGCRGWHRTSCGTVCRTTYCYYSITDTVKQKPLFKIYPNPVNSGAAINLELPDNLSVNFIVRIFSLSGAAVFQQKFSGIKTNTINLLLNSRLSASEYIVQLVDENGKAAGQQKIIVQ